MTIDRQTQFTTPDTRRLLWSGGRIRAVSGMPCCRDPLCNALPRYRRTILCWRLATLEKVLKLGIECFADRDTTVGLQADFWSTNNQLGIEREDPSPSFCLQRRICLSSVLLLPRVAACSYSGGGSGIAVEARVSCVVVSSSK